MRLDTRYDEQQRSARHKQCTQEVFVAERDEEGEHTDEHDNNRPVYHPASTVGIDLVLGLVRFVCLSESSSIPRIHLHLTLDHR